MSGLKKRLPSGRRAFRSRRFRSSEHDSPRDNYCRAEHTNGRFCNQRAVASPRPGGHVLLRTGEYSVDVARLSRPMNHRRVSRQRGRRVSTRRAIPLRPSGCREPPAATREASRSRGTIGRSGVKISSVWRLSLSRATQERVGRQPSGTATGIFFVVDGGGHESRVFRDPEEEHAGEREDGRAGASDREERQEL